MMQNKAIIHLMSKGKMKSDSFTAEIDAIEEISEKYGVKNIIFYKGEPIEYADLITKLEKFGIFVQNYSNKEDLKEKILEFQREYEIVYFSTPMELLINTLNDIKAFFGRTLSDNPDVFRNKYLQRDLVQKHRPELGVKFIKGIPGSLNIDEIEKNIGYPFIIKPIDGVQSAGVEKILTKKGFENYISHYESFHDRLKSCGIDNKELIVEEFIDGQLYSLDYFVNGEGETVISKPVKVKLGIDIKIDDYCNIARISTEKTEEEFKGRRLKTFVNSNVKACGIKDAFIHHEFKINSKGEFKTIELNGRLGGGRLDLMMNSYSMNMYEAILNPELKPGKIKENNIVIILHATKGGMLRSFNDKLLDKIKSRESVYKVHIDESIIGKETGLTKDGFTRLGFIKLGNKNYDQIKKDYRYIMNKYSELLLIDEFKEDKIIEDKGLFGKMREYLNS